LFLGGSGGDDNKRLNLDRGYWFPFLLPAFPGFDYAGKTIFGRGAGTLVTTAVYDVLLSTPVTTVWLFQRRFLRVLLAGTATSTTSSTVVLGRLYQGRSVFVRSEVGLLGLLLQRSTATAASNTLVMVLVVVPIRGATVPILQLLVVVIRSRRRRVVMTVSSNGSDGVEPAPR